MGVFMMKSQRRLCNEMLCSKIMVDAAKEEREREKRNKQAFREFAIRYQKERKRMAANEN